MHPPEQPLAGRSVVVTRPRHQAHSMAEALRGLGADVILLPAIQIQPAQDLKPLDRALLRLERYDWVVFTSVNGVIITWQRVQALGLSVAAFGSTRVAAIGPATARALRRRGLEPDFVPAEFVAEEVAAGIPGVEAARVLLPRAAGARPVLPQQLEARGAAVDEIHIYQAVRGRISDGALERLQKGVDALTFTSPSTVENFTAIVTDAGLDSSALPTSPLVACIGPITAEAAREYGYTAAVIADEYTSRGLVTALAQHYAQGEPNAVD